MQYQRRFVELASQVLTKLRETKQFYTLYNSLDDTKLYLTKEVKLLESVQENYTIADTSTKAKNQLLEQMTSIVQSLTDNYNKLVDRQVKEQSKRDELSAVLQVNQYMTVRKSITRQYRIGIPSSGAFFYQTFQPHRAFFWEPVRFALVTVNTLGKYQIKTDATRVNIRFFHFYHSDIFCVSKSNPPDL